MGYIGAMDGRSIAESHRYQRRLVLQLNGQVGAASPGQELHVHAFHDGRTPWFEPSHGLQHPRVSPPPGWRLDEGGGQWESACSS
jgi:hypothetical protein